MMFEEVYSYLKTNQFLAAALIAYAGMQSKTIFSWVKSAGSRKFVSSVTLNSIDSHQFYPYVCQWVFSLKSFKKIKTLNVTNDSHEYGLQTEEKLELVKMPAPGCYFGFIGWRFCWIITSQETRQYGGKTYNISINCFDYSGDYLINKINEIVKSQKAQNVVRIQYGDRTIEKSKRPISSILLQGNLKNEIVEKIKSFLNSKSQYIEKGIPYKLNFLINGEPGCGKSSLIFALASHFDLTIVPISPIMKPEAFEDLMLSIRPNSLISFEDIDCSNFQVSREDENDKKITLSQLLNSLDGLQSPEGCLTIITTNNKEKLDPALIRSGRIDFNFELTKFSKQFCIEQSSQEFVDENFPNQESISPAEFILKKV